MHVCQLSREMSSAGAAVPKVGSGGLSSIWELARNANAWGYPRLAAYETLVGPMA